MPNNEQAELINKHIGSCRFVYNLALEVKNYAFATQRKNLSCFDLISQLPGLKEECPWLKEVDSQALQQAVINLDKAFTRFFKGYSAFPKFKNKYKTQSFRNPHGNKVEIKDGKIFQPKFKDGINIIVDRKYSGNIKSTTISRAPTGKYFVSVLVETGHKAPNPITVKEETAIGIDLGIKDLIVTSDGLKVNNPKYLKRSLARLKYLNRQVSKKKKGSVNRKKAAQQLALLHEKIANQRKDFLHKLSSQLIKNHDTLCFEDLQVTNMVKNHKLAQAISDSGWGIFVEICKYKAEWYGKNILQIPTFQPSTKICSTCGHTNHELTLADRNWRCLKCDSCHDRDINAAINIKKYSLKDCGGVRRGKPVELPTLVGALKQEL
jgi:putative transposase